LTAVPRGNEDHRPGRTRGTPVQMYARIAGVLLLISAVAGGFGEVYVPSVLIVASDARATANNIIASDFLFRMGFASYLVEAVCDVALTLVLYVLLRPAGKDLSLLAAFFRLLGTAIFAVTEIFYFAASFILGGAEYLKTFSPDQLNTLALLSLRLYVNGGGLFFVIGGVAYILQGYLIFRSGYLPKFLGILLALGGLGFVIRSFALVLAPAYASLGLLLLLPVAVAGLSLTAWLLVKGVDVTKWEEKAALAEYRSSPS
jgi:hypothetical protein